ncbi:hypothetical protein LCGC14_1496430 [marine sediment metagenome]|uniref:J domain-containing protein n=1 Tax=marine sediment metagenome TaxID=412755 RepID=A0A0F9M6W1_9ZZZZ
MPKKLTAKQVFREVNDILTTFSGKDLRGWVDEGWAKYRDTRVGHTTDSLERAARAMDPYVVLGLAKDATIDQVQMRRKQLGLVYHPDREGGNLDAMKLVNNAADEVLRKLR